MLKNPEVISQMYPEAVTINDVTGEVLDADGNQIEVDTQAVAEEAARVALENAE